MLVRRNAQDYDVAIYYNKNPGQKKYISESNEITYPASKKYFLVVDGAIVKTSNSLPTIEKEYVKQVSEKSSEGFGRFDLVKHKLVENKVQLR